MLSYGVGYWCRLWYSVAVDIWPWRWCCKKRPKHVGEQINVLKIVLQKTTGTLWGANKRYKFSFDPYFFAWSYDLTLRRSRLRPSADCKRLLILQVVCTLSSLYYLFSENTFPTKRSILTIHFEHQNINTAIFNGYCWQQKVGVSPLRPADWEGWYLVCHSAKITQLLL